MKDVNKIILVGRLGGQPTLRVTKNGHSVAHFSLATTMQDDQTQWHQIVVWGKQAENCAQYLEKGQWVYIEGPVRSREYTTDEGQQKLIFEVIAETVKFIGYKSEKKSA